MPPALPYDVQLEVIEIYLAEDPDSEGHNHNLRLFSLISRPLLAFCQKQIFRKYDLGRIDGYKCYSILLNSPHLIAYVKQIRMLQIFDDVSMAEKEVIRSLTSVQNLTIFGARNHWCSMSLSVRRTILYLLSQPQITSLTLDGALELVFPVFTTWRYLKSLELREGNPEPIFEDIALLGDSDEETEDQSEDKGFSGLLFDDQSTLATHPKDVVIRLENLCLLDSDQTLLLMLCPDRIPDSKRHESLLFTEQPPRSESGDETGSENDAEHSSIGPRPTNCPGYHFDFSRTHSFTADITPANLRPVWYIIYNTRNSLITLDIRERYRHARKKDPFGFDLSLLPETQPINLPGEITLAPLSHLQSLSVTIMIRDVMPIHPDTLSSWCSLLRTAPPGVQTLEITLDAFYFYRVARLPKWFPRPDDVDEHGNPFMLPLTGLDEIISSPIFFPSLKRVLIYVELADDERLSNSEDGMINDIVYEEDLEVMRIWEQEDTHHRTTSPPVRTTDVTVQVGVVNEDKLIPHDSTSNNPQKDVENDESSPFLRDPFGAPNFADTIDNDSAISRDYPAPIEEVESSVRYMLPCTGDRFSSTGSFTIEAGMLLRKQVDRFDMIIPDLTAEFAFAPGP